VMTAMIKDMPEATDLFIAEEERLERERAEAKHAKAAVASALTGLDEHYGVTHAMGSVETDYSRSLLLGAVDMNGKRYARLEFRSGALFVCRGLMRSPSSSVARFRCIGATARKTTAFFTLAMPTATSTKKKSDASTTVLGPRCHRLSIGWTRAPFTLAQWRSTTIPTAKHGSTR